MDLNQKPLPYAAVELPNYESLNQRLSDALLSMKAFVPDKVSHTRSGRSYFENKWLSPNDLHQSGVPVFSELAAAIEEAANKTAAQWNVRDPLCITTMWSIIGKSGMEGRPHNHKGMVSVAYYVAVGASGSDAGGLIRFHTDRTKLEPTYSIQPRPGLLVVFPSTLFHSVSRYSSEEPRIVISANLR